MKPIVTRTYADFMAYAAERNRMKPGRYFNPDDIQRRLSKKAPFTIVAVASCGIGVGSLLHRDDYAKNWLTTNATGKWYIEYAAISWSIARVYFEDEGDAFRFTWEHENMNDDIINQAS